ncbi:MAG: hypothetical protein JXA03_05000 [Bacteroidales bacterium]|nr:hypothetical protein [Bacteroidales bacterium]
MSGKALALQFQQLFELIQKARSRALLSVNHEHLQLYWKVGAFIDGKLTEGSWGEKVVDQFSEWLNKQDQGISGFDRRNIYRMREFFLAWDKVHWSLSPSGLQIVGSPSPQIEKSVNQKDRIVVTLSPQFPPMPEWLGGISWSHHLAILSASKEVEERLFYLLLAVKENYTLRELRRQIKICKTKDISVVEYAMSRNVSAALIAEYQTKLIDKRTLQQLLNEWSENIENNTDES